MPNATPVTVPYGIPLEHAQAMLYTFVRAGIARIPDGGVTFLKTEPPSADAIPQDELPGLGPTTANPLRMRI